MTNKKDPKDIDIIDLTKRREELEEEKEKLPEFALNKLRLLLDKAEKGKVRSLVINFSFDDEGDQEDAGGTLFFNKSQSALKILGVIELMKVTALDLLLTHAYEETEE